MKPSIFSLTIIALIIFLGVIGSMVNDYHPTSRQIEPTKITISGNTVKVETATDDKSRERGLSGRQSLAPDHGMFFIFDREDYYAFWMPNMHFAIDIIWLDKNLTVVDIAKNVTPETYPKTFKPKKPAQYVLEVVSGFSDIHQINAGDQATLTK